MAAAPPMPHEDIKGRFYTIAHVTAKPDKADEFARLMKDVEAYCNDKSNEPGTISYRALRGAGPESNKFVVVEHYENRDALTHHRTGGPYLALRSSGTVEGMQLHFLQDLASASKDQASRL
ncbi:hypothetical protein EMMF5_006236 [Cystobasidiomycetes sp. EMM_F5]